MRAVNKNGEIFDCYHLDNIDEHKGNEYFGNTIHYNDYSPTLYSWGTLLYIIDEQGNPQRDGFEVLSGFYLMRDKNNTVFLYPETAFEIDFKLIP